jgi:hypothetical protein
MSATLTQRAEDPADFGTDKQGVAARWIAELKLAEKGFSTFWDRGEKIVDRYMDRRPSEQRNATRFNVLWSNIQTLKPAIYATPPKVVVQRRYLDSDPVARTASTILQRATQTMVDATGWHEVTSQCVDDYLLPGRGTPWVRYEPHFEAIQAPQVQAMEAAEDGMQAPGDMGAAPAVMPDADNQPGEPQDDGLQITSNAEGEEITYEEVCWDYVYWKDFYHSPSRTWQEVRWVARQVVMTREEGVERFGKVFRDVPMTWRPAGLDEDDENLQLFSRARVFEIWCKTSRKVYWICPDFGDAPLDERDDFLKLNDFFPCPMPLYATLSNGSLIPAPDFQQYQDQANELDDLTSRMANIARDVKVAGVFNAANPEIERLLNEGHEDRLIGVAQWATFAQGGGFKGAVDWLPLESMVVALRELAEVRERTKQDLYEITGIADIVRGQGAAGATATAERLKGQFAQLRLRDRVMRVARFCRDMVRISAEIIAKHFQPQTLLLLSDYQQTVGADPNLAMQAIQLLKNDQTRGFRIEIEVDSTIVADQEAEQQARVEFLNMAGAFLREAVPLAQQVPELAPLAGQMLLFGIRGFPVGREMETVFESALEQLAQASQQPKPEAPPDPAIVKAQMDAQISQQEMQLRAQEAQAKMASDEQAREQQAAIETAKLLVEQMRYDLENRKLDLEARRAESENNRAEADRALKSQDMGLKAREASAEREFADITATQNAILAISDALEGLAGDVAEAKTMASAPRRVTIERGPDGRAIGARQEVEGLS